MTLRVHWPGGVSLNRPWLMVESLILAVALLAIYLTHVERVMMHIDENNWILSSNAWEPFVSGDRSSPVWAESYWTLTAPPATRYIVGAGRALGGYGPDELVTAWTFDASAEQNAVAGAMPSDDLLWWARLPMAVLATTACLASFWLMRSLFGAPAAYTGLALLALSPWLASNLVRAMNEAPLVCSLLVAVAASMRLAVLSNRGGSMRAQLAWLAVAGVAVGLAGSVKLSGLTALAGVLAVWCIVVALGQRRRRLPARLGVAILGIALAATLVGLTLVALNPFLDLDPFGRLVRMVQFRAEEIRGQLQMRAWWPIRGVADRLHFIFSNVFEQAIMVHHPAAGVASLALWLVGLAYIVRRVYGTLRLRILDPAGAMLLVVLAAAGPMLATPLRFDRYLFLPVWFSALLVALGVTVCIRWAIGGTIRRSLWRSGSQFEFVPDD